MHDTSKIPFDLTIVGAGASGIISAYHYLKTQAPGGRILILDSTPRAKWGTGLAYAGSNDELLLNVPAGRMGISGRDPTDFEDWLRLRDPELLRSNEYPFVPRWLYAKYLRERFEALAEKCAPITHVPLRAESAFFHQGYWSVRDASGDEHLTLNLVLATGYAGVEVPSYAKNLDPQTCFDCFDTKNIKNVAKHDSVFIVGTGLSAIDVLRSLRSGGHEGRITFLSRHGMFPLPFVTPPTGRRIGSLAGMSPRSLFSYVRNLDALKPGDPENAWIYAALREQFQSIWHAWSDWEKRQFSEHIEPLWRVLRHRTPSQNWEFIHNEIALGRIDLIRGRILNVHEAPKHELVIEVCRRGHRQSERVTSAKLIFATGPKLSQFQVPRRFGFKHEPRLWRVGPASRDSFGESSAIAEIREQAVLIAREISTSPLRSSLIWEIFSSHPSAQQENYVRHMLDALVLARRAFTASLKLFLHAIFPFIYTSTASDQLRHLNLNLGRRRINSTSRRLGQKSTKAENEKHRKRA